MTNETEYFAVVTYHHVSQQLTKYVGIGLYIICLFGTTMNILTFMQRTYNSRACSLYLLIASGCDFVHLNSGPLSNILQYGFHYDWTINSVLYCKLKNYTVFVFTVLSATFTTVASIDRYVLSSRKTVRWKFSTRSIALRCIIFTILFWLIFAIPIPFCYTRRHHPSHNEQLVCSDLSPHLSCFVIQIIYTCILNGFLPPLTMIYFGLLTCTNARRLRQRSRSNSVRIRQINLQLTLMLVSQTIKFGFTSLPYTIFNSYLLITSNRQKSSLIQAKENLVNQIVYLLFWSNYTSFFVYVYSSDIFRCQCMEAVKKLACGFYDNRQKRYSHRPKLRHLTTTANIVDMKYKPAQIL